MPRPVRRLIVAVLLLAVVAVAALGGVGWYYSGQLLNVVNDAPTYDVAVRAAGPGTVTLARTRDTARPGIYGLDWAGGGWALLGPVTATTSATVTRRLLGGAVPPAPGRVNISADVWPTNPTAAVGIGYRSIRYPDPLGPMPAWYVPGRSSTWVVAVHGRGGTRGEVLRVLPTLHLLGLPVLAIDYRNDPGAPPSPDHLYHLGATEWQDVAAAVRYAVAHGAHRVVLYAWSMGGAIVEEFLQRSPDARLVPAVVLDAPVVSWPATLRLQAAERHLPGILTWAAEQVVHWRIGINWSDFQLQRHPDRVRVPTLLFAGLADTTVPVGPSRQLARARPGLVQFVGVPLADHTQAWNVEPAAYDARVAAFLRPYAATAAAAPAAAPAP